MEYTLERIISNLVCHTIKCTFLLGIELEKKTVYSLSALKSIFSIFFYSSNK